jgi:hypothetical protein
MEPAFGSIDTPRREQSRRGFFGALRARLSVVGSLWLTAEFVRLPGFFDPQQLPQRGTKFLGPRCTCACAYQPSSDLRLGPSSSRSRAGARRAAAGRRSSDLRPASSFLCLFVADGLGGRACRAWPSRRHSRSSQIHSQKKRSKLPGMDPLAIHSGHRGP